MKDSAQEQPRLVPWGPHGGFAQEWNGKPPEGNHKLSIYEWNRISSFASALVKFATGRFPKEGPLYETRAVHLLQKLLGEGLIEARYALGSVVIVRAVREEGVEEKLKEAVLAELACRALERDGGRFF